MEAASGAGKTEEAEESGSWGVSVGVSGAEARAARRCWDREMWVLAAMRGTHARHEGGAEDLARLEDAETL
jgi:hypothetical protein